MSSSIYETYNLPNTSKMYGNPICHVYIADGFQEDCESLIQKCIMKHDVLEYHMFCRIWKEMNMGCLYQGRTSAAEVAELSEEVLHIAKHYMVADTTIFEESVAGLFLVYSLMHLQPYKNFASLRLVPEDIPAIQRIESVARREKRYDVLYILASVLIKGPCQFHAAERERGMEPAIKKYLDGFKSIDSVRGVRSKGVFYRQTEELDLIRELGVITKKYSETKAQVMGKGRVDQSLQYINENLSDELSSSLKNLLNGFQDDDDDDIDDDNVKTEREHVNSVEEIKMKAMKEAVNPVKHLTGIVDRKQLKKSKKEKQIKIDKESETFNIDKKRRPSPNGNKNKKHKVNEDEANVKSEEAEIELHISYSDRSESSESDNENTENVESTVKSLPMLINDNVGAYEIEIIDESQSNEVTEQSVLPNISTVDVNIPTVPLTKVKKEKITKNISKKSHLKSRLSRLGMLKVASLDK